MTAIVRAWAAADRGRRAYEIGLAAALSAVTAALTLVLGDLPGAAVAGLAVLDLALVGLRHRFPAGVLIVAATLGSLLGRMDVALLFGLAFAAGYRVRGPWRLAAGLAAVLVGQIAGSWVHGDGVAVPPVLFGIGSFMVVIVFPATLARLSAQRRHILTLMHERTVHLRDQQRVIAEQARVREAGRIAREMHDSLGHRLTLMSLYTGALKSAPERSAEVLPLLHATSASAMEELRHILAVLRTDAGEESRERVTLADAEDLIAGARSAGAAAALDRSGSPVEVPAMVDQAAYRTLQEGITNALRHARGGAVRAAVRYEDDALVVEVVNGPGRPYEGTSSGQGLYGLAERVRIAGGVLFHGAEPDGGFRLAATLPLTSVAPRAARLPESVLDDFDDDLRRVDRRRRTWTVGAGLGVLLVLGMCAGGVWLVLTQQTVGRGTYEELRLGEPAARVREKLPDRSAELDPGLVKPPAKPGADCVAYRATPSLRGGQSDEGYRFCFRDGTLMSKELLDDAG